MADKDKYQRPSAAFNSSADATPEGAINFLIGKRLAQIDGKMPCRVIIYGWKTD